MKKVSKKYLGYLIIATIIIATWIFLSFQNIPLIDNRIMLFLGTFFIFSLFVTFQIYTGIGNLIDLDVKDAKNIWWSRVIILLAVSFIISYIVVFRNNKVDNIIRIIINSAAFGILLGYWIKKIEEKSKSRVDGNQAIRNLQVEVSNNRFNCQAMLKNWQPLFLQTFVWDNLKLTKHFELLWAKEGLTNKLSNLYLCITAANLLVNHAHLASYNIIHSPDQARIDIANKTKDSLKDYLSKEVLLKLEDMEKELDNFCKDLSRKR